MALQTAYFNSAQAAPFLKPGATVNLTVPNGSSGATASALGCSAVRLVSTVDCFLAFSGSPTATTDDFYLPAEVPCTIAVDPLWKIAAYGSGGAGNLFITKWSDVTVVPS